MDMNSRANADASIPDVDMDVEPLMHPHQHPDGSHGADAFDGLPNDTVAPASVTSSSTNSNSNANPNAAANGADEASTKRPYACNPCRERKVRCDREQPTCGRCVRRGHGCTYSGPSKQSITKLDLSRLLLNLQDRLSRCLRPLCLPPTHPLLTLRLRARPPIPPQPSITPAGKEI
jgi:hypothetical protein